MLQLYCLQLEWVSTCVQFPNETECILWIFVGVVLLFKILVEQRLQEKNVKTHGGDAPKWSEAQVGGFGDE